MAHIRLIQIDGKLPNLALMKLAQFHREKGDEVVLTRHADRDLLDLEPDRVYASAIFTASKPKINRVKANWPGVILGGTGTDSTQEVESVTGDFSDRYDYSIYPDFENSIGFTQRGCRLRCGFCVVPKKEGRPRTVNKISDIWREGKPKNLVLLDNDFFGQEEKEWRARIDEIVDGNFRVSFNQGINTRLLYPEACKALARTRYSDDGFTRRRLYTAWDNLKDEEIFFRGVDMLEDAGIPPRKIMVYMLVGYDPAETWDRLWYRFNRMVERGLKPYPMVYNNERKDLKRFQRWVVRGYYRFIPWEEFGKEKALRGR